MNNLLFPFAEYYWLYAGFIAFIFFMLALDLGVFHRKVHSVSFKEASFWSAFWIGLSLLFNYGFYRYALYQFTTDPQYLGLPGFDAAATASRVGTEFLTGFLIEKALAVDNIFVFVIIFSALKIPTQYQHRVLFFGILGALFFRAIFIAIGAELMAYHWVVMIFGAFLIITGVKLLLISQKPQDPKEGWAYRLVGRVIPMTPELHGQKFWIKKDKMLYGTPLLMALILVEFSDIIFAIDSVPAIFAITSEPMIVFTSNILAILGLRSLYFMLGGIVDRFAYLKYGLALVLVFVGLKMVWLNPLYDGKFPIDWSLGIIATLILGSMGASYLVTAKNTHQKGV